MQPIRYAMRVETASNAAAADGYDDDDDDEAVAI